MTEGRGGDHVLEVGGPGPSANPSALGERKSPRQGRFAVPVERLLRAVRQRTLPFSVRESGSLVNFGRSADRLQKGPQSPLNRPPLPGISRQT